MKKILYYLKKAKTIFTPKPASNSLAGIHLREVAKWKADHGEEKRYLYNLGLNSIIFDMGGYEGQFASDIYSRYRSKIFIFEPVLEYADNIKKRFSKNSDITIHPYGLSDKTEKVDISINENASSLFSKNLPTKKAKMIKASDFFLDNHVDIIDLMKINIEGGEYSLLENLIEHDLIKNIKNLQIQFHTFVPDAAARAEKIQASLSKTHNLTYQYPFVWENWQKK
ncbi:MAG: FkbM family methyltransferase [Patescibacteria group bacterium]|jgi:FkbM family methyltransferase